MRDSLSQKQPATGRDFWLDTLVSKFGFDWLAARLPGDLSPSVVFAIVGVTVPNILATIYHYVNSMPMIYTKNPYFALQPILLVVAVVGAQSLSREYDSVMEEMRIEERADKPDQLLDPIPGWLPWAMLAVAVTIQFVAPKTVPNWDLMDALFHYGVYPFIYTPIVIQFFTVYVSIEFIAPWRLTKSGVGIHFLDPHGVGGLRPLGELIKRAYYYMGVGLIGYAFITYGPFLDSWSVPPTANILFTIIWMLTIATVAFAVLVLHRFMHREKREEIQELEDELRTLIENPWDVKSYEIPEDEEDTIEDLRDRITRVSETSEYPATFSIWSQLVLSIALPKAIQLFIAGI